ncbi:hypothetical protein EMIHUDRAFT_467266 [Emiliania huxleyi CCMP1516]|uniref:Presenilin n=2 Tax=Emiliania huxleyi TaxID=2903 RepID=A0A0D3KJR9_EMIH1|nr:hypothetical protein EMIHUDRAFT_467266 [Emiliania huxleyi CCMP1516]EOD36004.1 hypothetical protein EMIHUDRAFT_467266 [Emiliania huxleyi CCMP1516]|eukprot:XP_005788433.1 hypothetical protein EMIHUDRAFT_467266 [Emiliania huxleyi CCMP1516]
MQNIELGESSVDVERAAPSQQPASSSADSRALSSQPLSDVAGSSGGGAGSSGGAGAGGECDGGDGDGEYELDPAAQVASLLAPVCATMAIVVYLLKTVDAAEQPASGFSEIMVYQEHSSDDAATIAGGVALNALAMVALLFVAIIAYNLTKLPEWTTWGVLGAVALWDIVAVLTPRGPLKVLVETAEQRNEPIPGLVYEGHGIKLGLGDFVFYSLLVGRACLSSITAFAACAIAVLAGLCATLALLPVLERVLPALPISVAVGILFYFISSSLIEPLAAFAADQSLFL